MENRIEGFEEMQHQVELLKQKLAKEAIVNECLMRKAMSSRVNSVERYLRRILGISILAMILMVYDFVVLFPLSVWFVVVTELLFVACMTFICWNRRFISSDKMMSGNLIEEGKRLVRFRKHEMYYISVSIPVMIVWIIWFILEVQAGIPDEERRFGLLFGGLIGGVIGFIIGLRMFFKMLHNINDVIGQIDELMEVE
ncbi:MAG: hypothetical protein NC344_08305 [Bacteroidales bacterium]|nr:hypothetical protein [Bacteroidales bacterium]MCM1147815.1 hypothetical protein [Bacteroidales bacterium]MCM1206463.1 hypothetical protein [Bacillota bacterium]MCM1510348.1 hypothetical protein [Clostridium sp.]